MTYDLCTVDNLFRIIIHKIIHRKSVINLNPTASISDMDYPDVSYSGQTLYARKVPVESFCGKIEN